jgi:beta-lactamase class A
MNTQSIRARIRAVFAGAGVAGWLHAADVHGSGQVDVAADEPVVLGSVFKVPLVVAYFRAVDEGRLDPGAPVTVPTDHHHGPTGIAAKLDLVATPLRDLPYLALTISDNAAADALADRLGSAALDATLAALGLHHTWIGLRSRDLSARTSEDLGTSDPRLIADMLADPSVVRRLRVLDPATSNRSTARDCSRLLTAIWRDEAASAESCGEIRRLLALQVWPHRLASGFPDGEARIAAKTGTLPTVRNEIGVVDFPDGGSYALAVFTRSASTAPALPRAEASIGLAARVAVDELRS